MAITTERLTPAQNAAKRIREIDAAMLAALRAGLIESYNTFWRNAQGAAPQEIADALGPDAAVGLQAHAALAAVVVEVCQYDGLDPGIPTAIPEGASYAIGADGRMSVEYTPPPPLDEPPPETPLEP